MEKNEDAPLRRQNAIRRAAGKPERSVPYRMPHLRIEQGAPPADRPPDAAVTPLNYREQETTNPVHRLGLILLEFQEAFYTVELPLKKDQGSAWFYVRHGNDSFNYPENHPQAGRARYLWYDRGTNDGVRYGYLVEPDHNNGEHCADADGV